MARFCFKKGKSKVAETEGEQSENRRGYSKVGSDKIHDSGISAF
jgi:hypothetical protein